MVGGEAEYELNKQTSRSVEHDKRDSSSCINCRELSQYR